MDALKGWSAQLHGRALRSYTRRALALALAFVWCGKALLDTIPALQQFDIVIELTSGCAGEKIQE